MSGSIRISLRAGERIYVNGAVLQVDRKVTIELLNDAGFLLESHVLQPESAVTPLRQLYFALQTMLMEPASETARPAYLAMLLAMERSFTNPEIVDGLRVVEQLVAADRLFEALKLVRKLFSVEERVLSKKNPASSQAA